MSLFGDRSHMQVAMSWVFAVIALAQCLRDEKSSWRNQVRKWAAVLLTNWGCGVEVIQKQRTERGIGTVQI